MIEVTQQNFGHWPSSIGADLVAGKTPRLAEPKIRQQNDEHTIFWLQSLPEEKGRTTIMMQTVSANGIKSPPEGFIERPLSVQSKAHEYGGGAYCLSETTIFFVLADDQRIYEQAIASPNTAPHPITPDCDGKWRFADLTYDLNHHALLAVCEDHSQPHQQPQAKIAYIALNKAQNGALSFLDLPAADFYSNPQLSPCGKKLSYLCWHHPNMPWDATELWVADISLNGDISNAYCVKGGEQNESIFQPLWSPAGDLYCVSDQTNWWNINRLKKADINPPTRHNLWQNITPIEAEFATPQWTFGMSCYGFIDNDNLFCTYTQKGGWYAAVVTNLTSQAPLFKKLDAPYTPLSEINAITTHTHSAKPCIAFIGSNSAMLPTVYFNQGKNLLRLGETPFTLDTHAISSPRAFTFKTGSPTKPLEESAYGFYYAPTHKDFCSTDESIKPPVILLCHGGPTGATSTSFNPKIQYWTSRGFAVLDINYRGSTGFGRHFRHKLTNNWGITDVEDMCNAKKYAVAQGWVDNNKCIIKGSSAGGYTVLAALTFTNEFNAGVSLYGIGDLELLANDTHKFESRYLDRLVGSYPKEKATYQARSPIHFSDQITCPVLVFQGLKDKVVPPNQAQDMVSLLREKGIPVTYVTFENEGHGFRDSENIKKMLEVEQHFYQTTLLTNHSVKIVSKPKIR